MRSRSAASTCSARAFGLGVVAGGAWVQPATSTRPAADPRAAALAPSPRKSRRPAIKLRDLCGVMAFVIQPPAPAVTSLQRIERLDDRVKGGGVDLCCRCITFAAREGVGALPRESDLLLLLAVFELDRGGQLG